MKRALKIAGLLAVVGSLGLAGQAFANCQDAAGPYEVIQCGQSTWFAPPPAGTGTITSQWWQLGFGNATNAVDPTGVAGADGSGFKYDYYATPKMIWVGNDSGVAQLDLAAAGFVGGPAGSLCFSSAANWAAPGVDGCADDDRKGQTPTASGIPLLGADFSDGILNRYWAGTTAGTLNYRYQVDAPMATLLTESNGLNFALAFFASASRGKSPTDITAGNFQMGALINGDPNPLGTHPLNVVPWQPVPQPSISATFVNPGDPTHSDRILAVSWTGIRLVHDGSSRVCKLPSGVACNTLGTATGVGVLDQGPLAHYVVESTPLDPNTGCGSTWAAAGPAVDHPTSNTSVTVPPNTCVRLKTLFGRTPSVVFDPTAPDPNVMWNAVVTGRLGDVGYFVVSKSTKVGGPLVSQKAVLNVADKNKNAVTVSWETTTELNITGFDIVGIDQKGGKSVLASAACKSCTTGLGQSYTQILSSGQVKDAKSLQIVIKPTGDASNILSLK